jgi:hypothetical protein
MGARRGGVCLLAQTGASGYPHAICHWVVRRVPIAVKETQDSEWICRPDDPYLPDEDVALPPTPTVAMPRQLPGAPGSLVLITSRGRLSGLVATDGAHPIPLDLLTPAEAHELLARRLSADRADGGQSTDAAPRCQCRRTAATRLPHPGSRSWAI